MTNPIDDYLDRINNGTTEATPEAFADFVAQTQAKIDDVIEAEGLGGPAPAGPEDKGDDTHHFTVTVTFSDHTAQTVSVDTIHANDISESRNGEITIVGFSYQTKRPMVLKVHYPEL